LNRRRPSQRITIGLGCATKTAPPSQRHVRHRRNLSTNGNQLLCGDGTNTSAKQLPSGLKFLRSSFCFFFFFFSVAKA